jgi:hypothetical protein
MYCKSVTTIDHVSVYVLEQCILYFGGSWYRLSALSMVVKIRSSLVVLVIDPYLCVWFTWLGIHDIWSIRLVELRHFFWRHVCAVYLIEPYVFGQQIMQRTCKYVKDRLRNVQA